MKPAIELNTTKTLIMVETDVCLLYLVQGSLGKLEKSNFWNVLEAITIRHYVKEVMKGKEMFLMTTASSAQFSRSVVSNSLWPHELQHARLPCP